MDLYFTDIFDVEPSVLERYGAFNISLVNDLPLFIDPFLLFNSERGEYQALHIQIINYLRFLRDRAGEGLISEGLLLNWFMFPEIKQNWLGFSLVGNSGSGLGIDFARALYRNLGTILSGFGSEKVTRDSHLEKLCLIKDGVGRDNISDFTTNLIKDYLLEYTQDFARQHVAKDKLRIVPVQRAKFSFATRSWVTVRYELPWHDGDYVILTPKDILTKDDTWINKADLIKDFEDVAHSVSDTELRAQINDYFLRILPEDAGKREIGEAVSRVITKYPQLIDFYIRYKEEHGEQAVSLSEQRVKQIEDLFIRQLGDFVVQLNNQTNFYSTGADTYQETRARVLFLKDVIENKGGHRLFFAGGEPIRRESDLQILFRLTWFATPSDISREVNDGRGPVDFKVSRGSFDKSLVEFKLAKNTQLKRNLEKQTEIYKKASDAPRALRVILYFSDEELDRVIAILRELHLQANRDVILIDARPTNKPSGSKA
jgi:hypothetical protein